MAGSLASAAKPLPATPALASRPHAPSLPDDTHVLLRVATDEGPSCGRMGLHAMTRYGGVAGLELETPHAHGTERYRRGPAAACQPGSQRESLMSGTLGCAGVNYLDTECGARALRKCIGYRTHSQRKRQDVARKRERSVGLFATTARKLHCRPSHHLHSTTQQ